MNTDLDRLPLYYTVYRKRSSPSSPSSRSPSQYIGSYADIRDAIQTIVTAYKRNPSSEFEIKSSHNKPLGLRRSKYQDEQLF